VSWEIPLTDVVFDEEDLEAIGECLRSGWLTMGPRTKAFEAAEKLAALNLKVAKAGLAEAAETSQAVLAAKDPQSLLAVQSGAVQPAAGKANEYATAVAAIMTETNPHQPRRKGGHQPSLPQYQAVMRGSFSGVYQKTRPRKRSATRPA